jgi:FkbM family methyltransferase
VIYPFLQLVDVVHDTAYGSIAVHRYDINQTQSIKNTKQAHDHNEIIILNDIYQKCKSLFTKYEKNKIIDIGCNFGLYGRYWAINNPNVHIDMYEPMESLYNISCLNTIHLPNVNVSSIAIGKNYTTVNLPVYDEKIVSNYGCTSLHPDEKLARNDSLCSVVDHKPITCCSLDFLYSDDDEYNFVLVKIDTEGTEGIILENSKKFIKNKKPILFVEHFPEDPNGLWVTDIERRGSYSSKWFMDFFEEIDYKIIASVGINILAIHKDLSKYITLAVKKEKN